MSAQDVLRSLKARGIPVFVLPDGRLRFPAGRLDPALREEVLAHKDELRVLLTVPTYPCTGCGRFSFPAPTRCFWCTTAADVAPDVAA